MKSDPQAFEHWLDEQLQQTPPLDELTQARLNAARLRALEQLPKRPPWYRQFAAAGLAAALLLSLLLATSLQQQSTAPLMVDSGLEALEIVAAGEDLEMLEDLDFYLWIDDEALQG